MTQKISPFLESKYGWEYGESGWNDGMDENLLKFSFLFDKNVDGITSSLPPAVNGKAYFLTTDNRIYFAVGGLWKSTPVPKWFTFNDRSTAQAYLFNGSSVVLIKNQQQLGAQIDTLQQELTSPTGAEKVGFGNTTVANALSSVVTVNALNPPVGVTTFQEMLDYLNARGGGVLYLPNGTNITLTSPVSVYENTTIRGQSKFETTIQGDMVGYLVNILGHNVTIEGITLLGPNSGISTGGVGVASDFNRPKFKDCIIDGFNTGIIALGNNRDGEVSGCTFRNAPVKTSDTSSGYGVVTQSCQGWTIENNVFEDTVNRHAIYLSRRPTAGIKSQNHIVTKNRFYGRKDGAASHLTGYEVPLKIMGTQDVVCTDNIFDGGIGALFITKYSDAAINDLECKRITISGNIFKDMVAASADNAIVQFMNRTDYAYDILISNNIADNCACNFVMGSNLQNVKIHGNNIRLVDAPPGLTSVGIKFTNSTDVKNLYVHNNYIKVGTLDRAIHPRDSSGTVSVYDGWEISDNTLEGGFYGIMFQAVPATVISNLKITNNRITSSSDCVRFDGVTGFTGKIAGNTSPQNIRFNNSMVGKIAVFQNSCPVAMIATQELYLVEPFGRLQNLRTVRQAAPTANTWAVGDRCINEAPVAGGYEGWVCTAAGTPGTWKGFGLIQA